MEHFDHNLCFERFRAPPRVTETPRKASPRAPSHGQTNKQKKPADNEGFIISFDGNDIYIHFRERVLPEMGRYSFSDWGVAMGT